MRNGHTRIALCSGVNRARTLPGMWHLPGARAPANDTPTARPKFPETRRKSVPEVGNAIPDQLDGNSQDEKAEDLVDRTHRAGPQPPHQWSAHAEEKRNA